MQVYLRKIDIDKWSIVFITLIMAIDYFFFTHANGNLLVGVIAIMAIQITRIYNKLAHSEEILIETLSETTGKDVSLLVDVDEEYLDIVQRQLSELKQTANRHEYLEKLKDVHLNVFKYLKVHDEFDEELVDLILEHEKEIS